MFSFRRRALAANWEIGSAGVSSMNNGQLSSSFAASTNRRNSFSVMSPLRIFSDGISAASERILAASCSALISREKTLLLHHLLSLLFRLSMCPSCKLWRHYKLCLWLMKFCPLKVFLPELTNLTCEGRPVSYLDQGSQLKFPQVLRLVERQH